MADIKNPIKDKDAKIFHEILSKRFLEIKSYNSEIEKIENQLWREPEDNRKLENLRTQLGNASAEVQGLFAGTHSISREGEDVLDSRGKDPNAFGLGIPDVKEITELAVEFGGALGIEPHKFTGGDTYIFSEKFQKDVRAQIGEQLEKSWEGGKVKGNVNVAKPGSKVKKPKYKEMQLDTAQDCARLKNEYENIINAAFHLITEMPEKGGLGITDDDVAKRIVKGLEIQAHEEAIDKIIDSMYGYNPYQHVDKTKVKPRDLNGLSDEGKVEKLMEHGEPNGGTLDRFALKNMLKTKFPPKDKEGEKGKTGLDIAYEELSKANEEMFKEAKKLKDAAIADGDFSKLKEFLRNPKIGDKSFKEKYGILVEGGITQLQKIREKVENKDNQLKEYRDIFKKAEERLKEADKKYDTDKSAENKQAQDDAKTDLDYRKKALDKAEEDTKKQYADIDKLDAKDATKSTDIRTKIGKDDKQISGSVKDLLGNFVSKMRDANTSAHALSPQGAHMRSFCDREKTISKDVCDKAHVKNREAIEEHEKKRKDDTKKEKKGRGNSTVWRAIKKSSKEIKEMFAKIFAPFQSMRFAYGIMMNWIALGKLPPLKSTNEKFANDYIDNLRDANGNVPMPDWHHQKRKGIERPEQTKTGIETGGDDYGIQQPGQTKTPELLTDDFGIDKKQIKKPPLQFKNEENKVHHKNLSLAKTSLMMRRAEIAAKLEAERNKQGENGAKIKIDEKLENQHINALSALDKAIGKCGIFESTVKGSNIVIDSNGYLAQITKDLENPKIVGEDSLLKDIGIQITPEKSTEHIAQTLFNNKDGAKQPGKGFGEKLVGEGNSVEERLVNMGLTVGHDRTDAYEDMISTVGKGFGEEGGKFKIDDNQKLVDTLYENGFTDIMDVHQIDQSKELTAEMKRRQQQEMGQ
ncbi:MAG: hypothetical protein FWE16_00020 [Firmicutes bacterium]|nr:hypothetical protein [Bacillota bacterium]